MRKATYTITVAETRVVNKSARTASQPAAFEERRPAEPLRGQVCLDPLQLDLDEFARQGPHAPE